MSELDELFRSPLKNLSVKELEEIISRALTEATGSRDPLEVRIAFIDFKLSGASEKCIMQLEIEKKIEIAFDTYDT